MSERNTPLLIIGGGIGGLTAALALAKRGREVHVIERSGEFGEIGAGIQIAPNASRVFDEIGVLADLHACAVLPARIVWMDMISGAANRLDLGAPFLAPLHVPVYGPAPQRPAGRSLERCAPRHPITLETDRNVFEIVDAGESMIVRCANGASYRAEALIAADGLWSKGERWSIRRRNSTSIISSPIGERFRSRVFLNTPA